MKENTFLKQKTKQLFRIFLLSNHHIMLDFKDEIK